MRIASESPRSPDVARLLAGYIADNYATSPPQSVHALDVEALDAPAVTFLTARDEDGGRLLGVGALRVLGEGTGEVKSLVTVENARRRGVGAALLARIIEVARAGGLRELNLETGVEDYFAAARRLYERHGFTARGPFAAYVDDPNSAYYGLALSPALLEEI